MKAKIITFLVAIVELITLKFWFVCHDFRSMMDISSVSIKLQLEDYIHNDQGVSMFVIRFFHNKIVGLLVNTLDKYLKYWDIRFISNVFSLIGVFGLIIGMWYVISGKMSKLYKAIIILFLLLWPLPYALNIIHAPFIYKFMLFISPYFLISLFGVWFYLHGEGKYRYAVVIVLSLLSLWWLLLLPKEVVYFCIE